jgi:hypothetical protein
MHACADARGGGGGGSRGKYYSPATGRANRSRTAPPATATPPEPIGPPVSRGTWARARPASSSSRGRYPTSGFAFSNRPGAGRRASGVSRAAPPHHYRIHRLVRSWSRSVFVLKKNSCFNFFHRSCSATQPPESAYTSAFDVCSARRES